MPCCCRLCWSALASKALRVLQRITYWSVLQRSLGQSAGSAYRCGMECRFVRHICHISKSTAQRVLNRIAQCGRHGRYCTVAPTVPQNAAESTGGQYAMLRSVRECSLVRSLAAEDDRQERHPRVLRPALRRCVSLGCIHGCPSYIYWLHVASCILDVRQACPHGLSAHACASSARLCSRSVVTAQ